MFKYNHIHTTLHAIVLMCRLHIITVVEAHLMHSFDGLDLASRILAGFSVGFYDFRFKCIITSICNVGKP